MIALAFWRKGRGLAPWGHLRAIHLALCHSLPRIGVPMFVLFGRSQDLPEVAEWIHGWVALGFPEAPLWVLLGLSPCFALWRIGLRPVSTHPSPVRESEA